MKSNFIYIIGFILLLLVACGEAETDTDTTENSRGEAPSTSLNEEQITAIENAVFTDFDGNELTLADFKGKTVLIDFWETWCAPCISVMPTLDKLMTDYDEDFVVLATSPLWTDGKEDVKRFINNNNYGFFFVHANELANTLSIRGIPYKVYVKPDGTFYKDEAGSRGAEREYQVISELIEKLRDAS